MPATHFTTVGFDTRKWKDIQVVVQRAAREGTEIETPHGFYVMWDVGAGVEIWVQVGPDDKTAGVHPHYRGAARMRASVASALPDDRNPLDGNLFCWADPQTEDLEAGLYPFVVTPPDFDLLREMPTPALRTLQVAAFAHQLVCAPDEDSFRPQEGLWGPEAFIPTGVVEVRGIRRKPRLRDRPIPEAMLSGRVERAGRARNPATEREFWALSVRTLGGTLDVVADPEVVEGEPAEGAVVQGEFWLSASVGD